MALDLSLLTLSWREGIGGLGKGTVLRPYRGTSPGSSNSLTLHSFHRCGLRDSGRLTESSSVTSWQVAEPVLRPSLPDSQLPCRRPGVKRKDWRVQGALEPDSGPGREAEGILGRGLAYAGVGTEVWYRYSLNSPTRNCILTGLPSCKSGLGRGTGTWQGLSGCVGAIPC